MKRDDKLSIIEHEEPNTFIIISKKIGEVGTIFKEKDVFVFRPYGSEKYFKAWVIANILTELNNRNNKH